MAENILSFLDARSLCAAELVSKEWNRVISEGMYVATELVLGPLGFGKEINLYKYNL